MPSYEFCKAVRNGDYCRPLCENGVLFLNAFGDGADSTFGRAGMQSAENIGLQHILIDCTIDRAHVYEVGAVGNSSEAEALE